MMTYEEWLALGISSGYCTPEFCWTHEAPYMHETETSLIDLSEDPCIKVVRLGSYDDWELEERDTDE
jgi:hypothetical protein